MTARKIPVPSGTTRTLAFATTYSEDWSEEAKRGTDILADDIEGATFLLKQRLTDDDEDAAVTKTLGGGITAADGTVSVSLTPSDTKDLTGAYYGTLRLYLAGGAVVDWEDTGYQNVPYVQVTFTQGAVEAVE